MSHGIGAILSICDFFFTASGRPGQSRSFFLLSPSALAFSKGTRPQLQPRGCAILSWRINSLLGVQGAGEQEMGKEGLRGGGGGASIFGIKESQPIWIFFF